MGEGNGGAVGLTGVCLGGGGEKEKKCWDSNG